MAQRVTVLDDEEDEDEEIKAMVEERKKQEDEEQKKEQEEREGEEEQEEPLTLSEEEVLAIVEASDAIKAQGNEHYKAGRLEEAVLKYTEALERSAELKRWHKCRAVYLGNRAACNVGLHAWEKVLEDCNEALKIDKGYEKAQMRRARAYEEMDKLELALKDYEAIGAAQQVARLEPIVKERREKQQAEMLDQLKSMGNTLLGKIGLSLDNFKLQPQEGGGYSIGFEQ